MVKVTQKAKPLLAGKEKLFLALPKQETQPLPVRKDGLDEVSRRLFEQLRLRRRELAGAGGGASLCGVQRRYLAADGPGSAR